MRLLPTAARLKLIFLLEIKAQFERNYSFSAYSVYVLVQKTLCGTGRFIVKKCLQWPVLIWKYQPYA